MSSNLFLLLWLVFAVVSILLLVYVGTKVTKNKNPLGAWIDDRGRMSLNRFQILMWTIIILPAFAALFFAKDFDIPPISAELLGLLGISAASAVTSGAIKSSKNIQSQAAAARKLLEVSEAEARLRAEVRKAANQVNRQTKQPNLTPEDIQQLVDDAAATTPSANLSKQAQDAEQEVRDATLKERNALAQAKAKPSVPDVRKSESPHWTQMLLEEEGDALADKVVSVTKFQSLILTLVAGIALVVLIAENESLDFEFPEDNNFLWLLGISQATYVGGKVPDKTKPPGNS